MKNNLITTVLIHFILGSFIISGLASHCYAKPLNQVVIYWDDTEKFTDIDAGADAQHHFTKRVKQTFNLKFAKLMAKLPAKYRWTIQIHDVDLAGQVTRVLNHTREPIRGYETFFNPSMTFSYRLIDDKKRVVANDKNFKLTDFYVTRYPSPRFMQRFLSYEQHMLDAWFNKVLLSFVLAQ